ncbi:COG3650 family protein [Alteraurantiacibacter buctensis]|uniref:Lipoprotein n=1 Tax=Alteraurantiacibacter buctensis TaxID=1503981 RepID=A0A844Z1T8_9SPHN|nr:hypothetical protein [Alteraurantiacibacter buctensis]MXO73120.1 hypothetical protein [Alteraurantiacibacter buctensis]
MRIIAPLCASLALLASCTSSDSPTDGAPAEVPGDGGDSVPFHAIAADEVVSFVGTEPFWGGEVNGTALRWSTPENPDGETITVSRFAGRGGLSFTGTLQGQQFDMAVTPATCSDGMSDRTYPYAVTVQVGAQQLSGCGWTDRQGYTGGE